MEREHSFLYDQKGKVRLERARNYLLDHVDREPDLQALKGIYSEWVNLAEFIALEKLSGLDKREFVAVPCSKRGNEIYYRRNRKRFRHLWQSLEAKGGSIFDLHGNLKRTKILFATLTWNSREISLADSWESEISRRFNRWISGVRSKFGKVSVLRSWESFESGYPHVQVLLYFHSQEFNVFRHNGKFRVQEKEDLQCGYSSHIDIQAMHSWKGAVKYLGKYILKQLTNEEMDQPEDQNKQLLTLALCWIFRKQSYSMSRDFLDLMQTLRNSKPSWCQTDLSGAPIMENVSWIFLGVFSFAELGIPPILKTQHFKPSSEFWEKIQ
jgi:Bacteriophage replication gene A protein (GPA).